MARWRYDSEWEEVKLINSFALLVVHVAFAVGGLGILMVTWTTVVLLGGFVSMLEKEDFWSLTLITLAQMLWFSSSFLQRIGGLFPSLKAVINLLKRNWLADTDSTRADEPEPRVIKRAAAAVVGVMGRVLALVHQVVVYVCFFPVTFFLFAGMLFIPAVISIGSLVKRNYYGDTDEGKRNMDPAHNVLYVLCVVQAALILYGILLILGEKGIVKQVTQAYGFQDRRVVSGYLDEIKGGCFKEPSSARGRNLITYAVELMESKSRRSFLTGTRILDRLISRGHSDKVTGGAPRIEEKKKQKQLEDKTGAPGEEGKKKKKKKEKKSKKQSPEEIMERQRMEIKRLIGSVSSSHILEKLLDMLNSRSSRDREMREASARTVVHVASQIRLEKFPRGIKCISSLICTYEQYRPLQPPSSNSTKNGAEEDSNISSSWLESESESESESNSDTHQAKQSNTDPLHDYQELVQNGLRILWRLAASEDNCIIISQTNGLVSKIMAPASSDLLHRTDHSAWSTRVVEGSLRVMLRLVTTKGETGAKLRLQISSNRDAIDTMDRIIRCEEECKGREVQIQAMQILTQLYMDDDTSSSPSMSTESRADFTNLLVSIFMGDRTDSSIIKETAGEALVLLFLGSKTILPEVNNAKFVGDLTKILVQDENNTYRKSAAKILEQLCIHYAEDDENLTTLKNAMTGVMPKVLEDILLGHRSTGQEGNGEYAPRDSDVERQDGHKGNTSSSPLQNKDQRLHVALLSLYVTVCEKCDMLLHTEVDDAISRKGGEGGTVSFARKMVELNSDLTADCLRMMKLTTRMVIATMKHKGGARVAKQPGLESLMGQLSTVSETMLNLEGSMVFKSTRMTTTRTLNSLVKEALKLHSEIKGKTWLRLVG